MSLNAKELALVEDVGSVDSYDSSRNQALVSIAISLKRFTDIAEKALQLYAKGFTSGQ